ncbi:CCA tRNA nucleotidyltransferase [Brevibacterium sp. 91QC2O2]|uniref:CCA tRNA nucleotidyltransferase n=1 Tax=Brevibacterium sp. 91QC2O2 TaxID=2968458 RepID=UPI00211C564C|nr:CCA tRNA nucleotidyltransferase [Brevibacterium sp. 91QC2O2]
MFPAGAHTRLQDVLDTLDDVLGPLGRLFADAGFELALVGGSVRDALLGRDMPDLDFTTDAGPDEIERLIKPWADTHWDIGRKFGTIGMLKRGYQIEITTYRAEKYDPDSRKPQVAFGDNLDDDLIRRDFTIGAMAVRLPGRVFVDPFNGLQDLENKVIRTPASATMSFNDDPLRMMRAARFTSQLGFTVSDEVKTAMTDMAERITIISAERVRDELVKLMKGIDPAAGIDLLVSTGIADHVLPEVAGLRLERDEHHRHKDVYQHTLTVVRQAVDLEAAYMKRIHAAEEAKGAEGTEPTAASSESKAPEPVLSAPDFIVRFAALMHDIGKPSTRRFEAGGAVTFYHHDVVGAKLTRKRMRALHFDKDTISKVSRLVELHLRFYGYGDAGWSDSAVRRYVTDAGELLTRLHILTRADVTTRNRKKADRLAFAYDDLEERITRLAERERLDAIRPDLDGKQIMEILQIAPGPVVGRAYRFLLETRMEQGPLDAEAARAALLDWWSQQPESGAAENQPTGPASH